MTEEADIPRSIRDFSSSEGYMISYAVIDMIIGVVCGLLNGLVMLFYRNKLHYSPASDKINETLYFTMSVLGIGTAAGALLHVIIFIFTIHYNKGVLDVVMPVAFVLVILSTYVSTLVNTVLAVVRTLSIARPVYRIDRSCVLCCVFIYGGAWLAVIAVDLFYWIGGTNFSLYYYYCFINVSSANGLMNLLQQEDLLAAFVVNNTYMSPLFIWGIPCVIPSFICLACFLIQIIFLYKRKRVTCRKDKVNRKATVTILLLTLVFIICNTTSFTYCISMVLLRWSGNNYLIGVYAVTSILSFLNATLNPVILITRGAKLRAYALCVLTRTRVKYKIHYSTRKDRVMLTKERCRDLNVKLTDVTQENGS